MIVTTCGHIIYSNNYWPGKDNDSKILQEIFEKPADNNATDLMELITSNRVTLILDRGFERFANWIAGNQRQFPNLKVRIPVKETDVTGRYEQHQVNQSRMEVTSIRHVVENVFSAEKHFKIHSDPVTPQFLKERFPLYHPFINATLNAYGASRASEGPRSQTFTDQQRHRLLTNNPSLLETTLVSDIFVAGNILDHRRYKRTNWREVNYDDPELMSIFPSSSEKFVMSINAGPYLVKKARGYIPALLDRFRARKQQRTGSMPEEARSIASSLSSNGPYKIEILQEAKLRNLYDGQLTALIRCHVLSFHSSGKKFKAYVGVRRVNGNAAKYTLACTCNTGTRFTGCVHSTLIIFLFSHYFKQSH